MASHNLKRSKLQRTKDSISTKTFSDLPISEILKQALLKTNFNQTTPIQNKALSKIRCSANKIIHGKSGTGKTMIFSILAIEKYLRINVSQRREGNAGLISVILCPTREIAIQGYFTMFEVISEVNRKLQEKSSKSDENNQRYGGYNLDKIKLALAIGGTNEDRDSLIHSDPISRANILIGTTGKIRSFLRSKKCSLKKVRIICFDEADKLFESRKADRQAHDKQNSSKERTRKSSKDTMRQQVISILEDFELPNMVQYVGLSATFDENLQKDLNGIMNEYIYIKSDENEGNQNENDDNRRISQLQGVLQYFVELPARSKLDLKIKTAFEITQICPYTQFGVLENENVLYSLFLFLGPITSQDTLIPNQWWVTEKWNSISMITFVIF